ncbi:MAG: SnoaL-like domain-containing protein [Bacteroidota bacterium]
MTTAELANQLLDYCKKGQWTEAHENLYADHAVSIEPEASNFPPLTEGKEAIIQKGHQFDAMVDTMHNVNVEGPVIAGNYFSCKMEIDVTFKGQERMVNPEICLYKVEEGKIVSEQFFYQ